MRLDVYVAVDNLERATEFYRMVFGDGPVGRTPHYVGFRVGAGRFGLMARTGTPFQCVGETAPFQR